MKFKQFIIELLLTRVIEFVHAVLSELVNRKSESYQ
ncbi:hypothetical protein VIRA109638_00280 [Vibrio rarus]